jgi:DNA segregation ATPase FtsK/SpoIIIE-like protein
MGRKRKNGILIDLVVEIIIKQKYISTPYIQRKFQISYLKAQEILKQLEKKGYIEKVEEFNQLKVVKDKYIQ